MGYYHKRCRYSMTSTKSLNSEWSYYYHTNQKIVTVSYFFILLLMSTKTILVIILLISLAGTLISLYFWYYGDPIANIMSGDLFNLANALQPCSLCWYARIALYPMVIISFIWLITYDDNSIKYLIPLSSAWLLITGYQIFLQAGIVADQWFCIPGSKSCAVIDWEYFGVTIPMLACAAFILILGLCIAHHMKCKKD